MEDGGARDNGLRIRSLSSPLERARASFEGFEMRRGLIRGLLRQSSMNDGRTNAVRERGERATAFCQRGRGKTPWLCEGAISCNIIKYKNLN